MGNPGEYHLLSAAEKRQFAVDRIREPDIACPHCGTRTLVKDLVAHVAERCPGHAPIHGLAAWVTWPKALALGVKPKTLSRWVQRGRVRSRGRRGARLYLLRDVVNCLALRRRPMDTNDTPAMPEAKPLTKAPAIRTEKRVADPLDMRTRRRLQRFADQVGGYAPAGRKLDISADTIRRAAHGERIRRGTATLIELQLHRMESNRGG